MGQVALGLRSLAFKLMIFVVLAALLAWALGGTLWPRAQRMHMDSIQYDGLDWHWRLSVGGNRPGQAVWELIIRGEDGRDVVFEERCWVEVVPDFMVLDELFIAGRPSPGRDWQIERIEPGGHISTFPMPDRLAVEQQLSRLGAGLPLQDPVTIERERDVVLEPGMPSRTDAAATTPPGSDAVD